MMTGEDATFILVHSILKYIRGAQLGEGNINSLTLFLYEKNSIRKASIPFRNQLFMVFNRLRTLAFFFIEKQFLSCQ